jgi:predicted nucleotidyltransferase
MSRLAFRSGRPPFNAFGVTAVPYSRAVSVAESLARLRAAADDGRLEALAQRHGVGLITVFGSAMRTPGRARDLDVAVSLPTGTHGLLALVEDLADLTAGDAVDLLVLEGASPTARFAGLVGAQPLYEASPGLFARTQMAAALEFYETAWLRDLDLQRMATS